MVDCAVTRFHPAAGPARCSAAQSSTSPPGFLTMVAEPARCAAVSDYNTDLVECHSSLRPEGARWEPAGKRVNGHAEGISAMMRDTTSREYSTAQKIPVRHLSSPCLCRSTSVIAGILLVTKPGVRSDHADGACICCTLLARGRRRADGSAARTAAAPTLHGAAPGEPRVGALGTCTGEEPFLGGWGPVTVDDAPTGCPRHDADAAGCHVGWR